MDGSMRISPVGRVLVAIGGGSGGSIPMPPVMADPEPMSGVYLQAMDRLHELQSMLEEVENRISGTPANIKKPEPPPSPNGMYQTALDVRALAVACRDRMALILSLLG